MTEGEHPAVALDLMAELFRRAAESTARSTRLFSGDVIDDVFWTFPEFGGEW